MGGAKQKQSASLQHMAKCERIVGERKYEAIEAILRDICAASDRIIMHSLSGVLKDAEVDELIRHGIMPYIYAAGFLSFAGREINHASLAGSIRAIGLTPDDRIIALFLGSGVRSHLVYLYSFYFLLANGVVPTREGIAAVVCSLSMAVDPVALDEVLDFLRRNNRFTKI